MRWCALLFRYTQQETIGLDLFFGDPAANSCRYAKLHCMVAADQPVSATVGQAAAEIAVLREAASEHDGNAGSNVALSFVSTGDCLDETDRHDVHFIVRAEPATLEVAYNSRLFKAATIDRLADALVRVFEATLDRPTTPICHLPVLSAGDLHTITVDWDSGCAEYPEEPVHRVFERLARERPEAVAASFEGKSLTYGELDAQSSRLAHHLIACGVLPGSAVAVCVLPSLDIVVAFLAIWKAGAVYVPLDPTHPEALIAAILDEVQPAVVLTQSKLRPLTNPQRHAQFCFDTDCAAHEVAADQRTRREGHTRRPGLRTLYLGHHGQAQGRRCPAREPCPLHSRRPAKVRASDATTCSARWPATLSASVSSNWCCR